uniref:RRM domain-containing protein n=1 Tax=Leptobrachium leishanense TaxID=445787 RepID=A0A8C5QLM2_9ANUR
RARCLGREGEVPRPGGRGASAGRARCLAGRARCLGREGEVPRPGGRGASAGGRGASAGRARCLGREGEVPRPEGEVPRPGGRGASAGRARCLGRGARCLGREGEVPRSGGRGLTGDQAIEDPELEAIKARVREMEEEAEKLKELQNEVEKQMNKSPPTGNAGPDARSIYVGNVDYGATAEELEAHFHGCGSVNRVTILCDKYTGHPKGFAYIEFSDKESVRTSMALDESLNRPGISSTDRGYPRARFRAKASSFSSRSRFYSGFTARPRGRVYRGRLE